MRKIAIFTSGESAAALRVVSLFNEGNRIHVVGVVGASPHIAKQLKEIDNSLIIISPEEWDAEPEAVLLRLKDEGVEKIAVESSVGSPDAPCMAALFENMEAFILTSEEKAPMEVVEAFKAAETVPPTLPGHSSSPTTPEEEWAKVLKMDYDPATAGEVPPPIPGVSPATSQPLSSAPVNVSAPTNGASKEEMPKSYLVWAVLSTVLCCMIPGIVAIIFSAQVSSKYYMGDIEGSRKSSERAQIWIIVSFVLGVLSNTLALPIALF